MQSKTKINRWVILIILGLSGGIIYELPYIRYTYYTPLQESLGVSNVQMGVLMTVYSIMAMFLYAPSGFLADRFSHRKLLTFSMIASGLCGIALAQYPPYWVCLALQAIWALTTILTFWSAMLKSASMLGTDSEQGKIMGWLEGIRGAGCMLVAFLTMGIFSKLGGQAEDLSAVILTYSIVFIVLGIVCWFVVPEGKVEGVKAESIMKNVVKVLKQKTTWYISIIIFSVYTIFVVQSYTAPYLTDVFGMTAVAAGTVAIFRNQVFRAFCAPIGGTITAKTRFKSPTQIIIIGAILTSISMLIFVMLPASPAYLKLLVGLLLFSAFLLYINRGLYFATVGEVKTPIGITGATIGIASVIGYLPDTFLYVLIGHWQDKYPGALGYKYAFSFGVGVQFIAVIAAILLYREIKKRKNQTAEQVSVSEQVSA